MKKPRDKNNLRGKKRPEKSLGSKKKLYNKK
jgi:hypothetical protein